MQLGEKQEVIHEAVCYPISQRKSRQPDMCKLCDSYPFLASLIFHFLKNLTRSSSLGPGHYLGTSKGKALVHALINAEAFISGLFDRSVYTYIRESKAMGL